MKAEKKSSKQRVDSLAKEMSRICKNGMDINSIENIIQEHTLMTKEVTLLRSQKRKALDELEACKLVFEDSIQAQQRVGIEGEATTALKKCMEFERVITELTEYVNAKEMQRKCNSTHFVK